MLQLSIDQSISVDSASDKISEREQSDNGVSNMMKSEHEQTESADSASD